MIGNQVRKVSNVIDVRDVIAVRGNIGKTRTAFTVRQIRDV